MFVVVFLWLFTVGFGGRENLKCRRGPHSKVRREFKECLTHNQETENLPGGIEHAARVRPCGEHREAGFPANGLQEKTFRAGR